MLRKSTIRNFTAPLMLILLASACSSVKVVSFENPRTDFSKFQEYTLKRPMADNASLSPEGRQFISKFEDAIKAEMSQRGYQLTYSPDIEVFYDIHSSSQKDTNVTRSPTYYNPWYFGNTYRVYENNYTESIVFIEIKAASTGKIAWQGSLDLRHTRNTKNKENIIPEAVQSIFGQYPYQAGSNKKIQVDSEKK